MKQRKELKDYFFLTAYTMTNVTPLLFLSTETSECKNITHLFGVCWSKLFCLCHTINNDISSRESTAQIVADPQDSTCLGKQMFQLHVSFIIKEQLLATKSYSHTFGLCLVSLVLGLLWGFLLVGWVFCVCFCVCGYGLVNSFCFSRKQREVPPIRGTFFLTISFSF